jgi:hypothetical protein
MIGALDDYRAASGTNLINPFFADRPAIHQAWIALLSRMRADR